MSSLAHLTSGEVSELEVPGTHWTMLFGEHAEVVGEAVMQVLNDLDDETQGGRVQGLPTILGAAVIENHFVSKRSISTPMMTQASIEVLRHLRADMQTGPGSQQHQRFVTA